MEIADYIVAEDRELVALVLGGDDTAFEYLFNRYRDAIHRLFVQRLGGTNDADDLLQETFIKVYINLHRYSRGVYLRTVGLYDRAEYVHRLRAAAAGGLVDRRPLFRPRRRVRRLRRRA